MIVIFFHSSFCTFFLPLPIVLRYLCCFSFLFLLYFLPSFCIRFSCFLCRFLNLFYTVLTLHYYNQISVATYNCFPFHLFIRPFNHSVLIIIFLSLLYFLWVFRIFNYIFINILYFISYGCNCKYTQLEQSVSMCARNSQNTRDKLWICFHSIFPEPMSTSLTQ